MISYSRSEIISSSRTAKNLGQILKNLKTGTLERAIISRNNELEAVLLSIDVYEKIMETVALAEHLEIAKQLKDSKDEQPELFFNAVLKKRKREE